MFKDQRKRLEDQELQIELARSFMALYANTHRDPKKRPAPFLPQDFYKLSYDTQLKQEVDPDLFARVAKRLGSTIKNKEG
jgi:hypothetical protein